MKITGHGLVANPYPIRMFLNGNKVVPFHFDMKIYCSFLDNWFNIVTRHPGKLRPTVVVSTLFF